jgi:hypothetical protein
MKRELKSSSDEPVGIVISRGPELPTTPRFTAYVWGPAPDIQVEVSPQAA